MLLSVVCLAGTTAGAQDIFTVAGIPWGHRKSVDGLLALSAPLDSVYGCH